MAHHSYAATLLIPPEIALEFSDVVNRFREDYIWMKRTAEFIVEADRIRLEYVGWTMQIVWESGPHIADEAREIAEQYAPDFEEQLAECDRRLLIIADDDPDRVYYNDFVSALNVLGSIDGCFVFDPNEGTFIGDNG